MDSFKNLINAFSGLRTDSFSQIAFVYSEDLGYVYNALFGQIRFALLQKYIPRRFSTLDIWS